MGQSDACLIVFARVRREWVPLHGFASGTHAPLCVLATGEGLSCDDMPVPQLFLA